VIAFESPVQGGTRALHGLTSDHDWDKPVGSVLDHFGLERAGLVDLSMDGYWALRAAGREPRIDRVVSWPPVYDWLHRLPPVLRGPVRSMLGHRDFMRWSVRTRARLLPTLRMVVEQVLYMLDSQNPADVVDWFRGMNAAHLGSQRVHQDVLLMAGEHNAFQPSSLARAQARALIAAGSVSTRLFTRAQPVDQHCQLGNLELACQVLTTRLHAPSPAERPARHRPGLRPNRQEPTR
jgi:pimeloyl-ACP methyl ester carboxylesterase